MGESRVRTTVLLTTQEQTLQRHWTACLHPALPVVGRWPHSSTPSRPARPSSVSLSSASILSSSSFFLSRFYFIFSSHNSNTSLAQKIWKIKYKETNKNTHCVQMACFLHHLPASFAPLPLSSSPTLPAQSLAEGSALAHPDLPMFWDKY